MESATIGVALTTAWSQELSLRGGMFDAARGSRSPNRPQEEAALPSLLHYDSLCSVSRGWP